MAQQAQARVAIVTGANKGIGLAIVRRMCKVFNGDVVLTARDESRGRKAITQLEGEGLHPKFHQLDTDSRDSITKVKEFLKTNYEGMYLLVLIRNLASLLHSTGANKPNETNKTVVLLQIYVEKITKATKLLCPLYFH